MRAATAPAAAALRAFVRKRIPPPRAMREICPAVSAGKSDGLPPKPAAATTWVLSPAEGIGTEKSIRFPMKLREVGEISETIGLPTLVEAATVMAWVAAPGFATQK